MSTWQLDVQAFHEGCDLPVGRQGPLNIDPERQVLRWSLMEEELDEIGEAMVFGNLAAVADGIADLIYVALGTAVEYGIDLDPVWDAVQASNMLKLTGPKRADGKQLKPEGWQPPDIRSIIRDQRLAAEERARDEAEEGPCRECGA